MAMPDTISAQPSSDLRDRTKNFAICVIRLFRALPKAPECRVIGLQVLRAGTSVGANYREALRARSQVEYVSKLGVCLQELDETSYWLELLVDGELVPASRLRPMQQEVNELTAIMVTLAKKAGAKNRLGP